MSQFLSPRTYGLNAEDIGIEPNTRRYISLSRRTLSPSRFIFRSVHDGLRSHYLRRIRSVLYQLSYVNLCGQDRVRSCNLSVNSRLLYQLSYLSIVVGEEGLEPPVSNESGFTDRAATNYRLLSLIICTPYRDRTCDLLYVRQPLLPSELKVYFLF